MTLPPLRIEIVESRRGETVHLGSGETVSSVTLCGRFHDFNWRSRAFVRVSFPDYLTRSEVYVAGLAPVKLASAFGIPCRVCERVLRGMAEERLKEVEA